MYVNGRVEIIANDQGNRITPSVVAFSDAERLIGEAAKNQAALNPTNTVYDAKRLIGRKYVFTPPPLLPPTARLPLRPRALTPPARAPLRILHGLTNALLVQVLRLHRPA